MVTLHRPDFMRPTILAYRYKRIERIFKMPHAKKNPILLAGSCCNAPPRLIGRGAHATPGGAIFDETSPIFNDD
jgi:hypothetical protein